MNLSESIERVRAQVQNPLEYKEYENTNVKNNTNCFAYAIGATFPEIKLYRLGLVSGEKTIDQEYYSTQELVELMQKDLKVFGLKYEIISEEDIDFDIQNVYYIKLYAVVWANGKIGDFHFIRGENGKWTEKRRHRSVVELSGPNYYDTNFLYHKLATIKITRNH